MKLFIRVNFKIVNVILAIFIIVIELLLLRADFAFAAEDGLMVSDWIARGDAYQQVNRPEEAIDAYTKVIDLKPDHVIAYFNRALLYSIVKKDYGKAIEDYERVIRLQPGNITAYYNRGEIYRTILQHNKAINDYRRIITIDAKAAPLAYYGMASTYSSMTNIEKACKYLDKAVSEGFDTWMIELSKNFDYMRKSACYKRIISGR